MITVIRLLANFATAVLTIAAGFSVGSGLISLVGVGMLVGWVFGFVERVNS